MESQAPPYPQQLSAGLAGGWKLVSPWVVVLLASSIVLAVILFLLFRYRRRQRAQTLESVAPNSSRR